MEFVILSFAFGVFYLAIGVMVRMGMRTAGRPAKVATVLVWPLVYVANFFEQRDKRRSSIQ